MDQRKTGKFIAACRKEKSLTQAQLAELMGVSDRAVSKWETGRSMPDSSIMLDLCDTLGINVNELLTGERIAMEDYRKMAEENLLQMKRQEEKSNKGFLRMELVIGFVCTIVFAVLIFASAYAVESMPWKVTIILTACVLFLVGISFCLKIEREAGYYECAKCHHRYVPEMTAVLFSMHAGRTRYMKCPHCGERSWQKKVLTRE